MVMRMSTITRASPRKMMKLMVKLWRIPSPRVRMARMIRLMVRTCQGMMDWKRKPEDGKKRKKNESEGLYEYKNVRRDERVTHNAERGAGDERIEGEEHDSTDPMEPPSKKQKLLHAPQNRGTSVAEVPVILARSPCRDNSCLFHNTWSVDCLLQLILTGASDYEVIQDMVMNRAKEEDFYIFIQSVLREGLSGESYAVRASLLKKIFYTSNTFNENNSLDCQLHIGSAAAKLLMNYPRYNERRLCKNNNCRNNENRPVSVLAVNAADVPLQSFSNILPDKLIFDIQGRSCLTCGSGAGIINQEMGDLVIFDLITHGNSMTKLHRIPTFIVNPLSSPSSNVQLIGAIE